LGQTGEIELTFYEPLNDTDIKLLNENKPFDFKIKQDSSEKNELKPEVVSYYIKSKTS